jgi:type VI secretion system protein ImpE
MHFRFAGIESLDSLQSEQQQRIRDEPTSAAERFGLFQTLSMRGDWEGANRQLRQALNNDSSLLPIVRSYQLILDAELQRERCLHGEQPPQLMMLTDEAWALSLAEDYVRQDNLEHLASHLAQAPALRGEIDVVQDGSEEVQTETFDWIADGDSRLGPMLELIHQQGYCWLPMSQVREIEISAPQSGFDRLWTRVAITRTNGERLRATIPVRYAGNYTTQPDSLLLGRGTRWNSLGDAALQLFTGEGQRMWITDVGEFALLDVRAMRLHGGTE